MVNVFKIILLFILLAGQQVFAQISPGDLATAHAHLEGISNCTKCHVLGEKETTSKCLECHTEIKNLISNNKGYHASSEARDKKCASCHGEHFGRDFTIVRFDTTSFDHKLTGYELVEKHEQITCSKCHTINLIENKISQKKEGTYLGLGTTCLSCHDDYHQNTLATDCASCHNQNEFKPAPFFKHENSNFPLLGKHKQVDCEKCHAIEVRNEKKFQLFSKIQHSNCTNCHEDVHKNKFGNNCKKCHSEESFQNVKNLNTFDHSKTNYPLEGSHIGVDCVNCHKGSFTNPIKHINCSDCHEDYHEGQFLVAGEKPDCSECHSLDNFTTTTYNVQRHNESTFKLRGSHLATPCFLCHKKEEKWEFKSTGTQCIDCHNNIHENYIDVKYFNNGSCLNCHDELTWEKINFNHSSTNFLLTGKHKDVTCRQCHFNDKEEITTQIFKGLDQNCTTCHSDNHYNQFDINEHADCERCHTTLNWEPDKFNHDNSRFKLDGAHLELDCIKCHKINIEIGNYIIYKFKEISCASCHS